MPPSVNVSSAAAASNEIVSSPLPAKSTARNAAISPGSPHNRNLNGWRAPAWTAPVLSRERKRLNVWAAPKTELFIIVPLTYPQGPGCYVPHTGFFAGSSV